MKKTLLMALAVLLLFSAMPVYAAEAVTPARQNANYMMSTAADGAPNWFNGTYYSSLYPDLQQAFGTNEAALYQHAMTHGFKEGRLVLPILDVAKYRAFYPDLDAAFGDNWGRYVRHYFEYGIFEGRANFTGFDPVAYLEMYPDLRAAFGTDLSLAARHYLEYGMTEGRAASRPVVVEKSSGSSLPSGSSRPSGSGDGDTGLNGVFDDRDSSGTGWVNTYVDGVRVKEEFYEAGVLVSCFTYDANGRVLEDVRYDPDGSGFIKSVYEYSADGLQRTVYNYYGDEYQGRDEFVLDEQGRQLTMHVYDSDGALQGYWTYKYEHPAPYENRCSEEEVYSGSGTLSMRVEYNTEDLPTAIYNYDGTGALTGYTTFEYGFTGDVSWLHSKRSEYNADGILQMVYYFDETGTVLRREEYDADGSLVGTFDADGNPII